MVINLKTFTIDDRIVEKLVEVIKNENPRERISSNILTESVFTNLRKELKRNKKIIYRKHDIFYVSISILSTHIIQKLVNTTKCKFLYKKTVMCAHIRLFFLVCWLHRKRCMERSTLDYKRKGK